MLILIFVLERQMVNIRPQVRRSKIMVRATALAYILIIASTVYGTDVLADHASSQISGTRAAAITTAASGTISA